MARQVFRTAGLDIDSRAAEKLCQTAEAEAFVATVAAAAGKLAREFTPGQDEKEAIVAGGMSHQDGSATSQIGSRSPIWHIIEFGSVNNPAYRPMTRAVEALGLRYDPL